jgi:CRP-like cAMP-binding protein
VTDSTLIERLAAVPTLASIPRDQIEWLAAHGEVRHYPTGHVLASKGQSAIADLWIVLSGRFSIQIDQGGIARTVRQWTSGDLSGLLPYSRLSKMSRAVSGLPPSTTRHCHQRSQPGCVLHRRRR